MTENVPPRGPGGARAAGAVPGGRTVPLVLVVGGLLLAAAALRPDGGLLGTPGEPPVGGTGAVVLIAVGWAGLVGRFAVHLRETVRPLAGPTPRAERLRTAAVVLLGGAAAGVPVLALVLHNRLPRPAAEGPERVPVPQPTATETDLPEQGTPADVSGPLAVLLYVLVAIGVALLVVALLRSLVFRLRRRRYGGPLPGVGPVGPAPEDVLAAAVETARRSLHGADARAAVIACYAAMERSLAESGLRREVGDSPAELLERAVADDRVDRAPAHELTELFREARYSTHPMDDDRVRRARTALDAIAARLAAARPDGGGEPATGPAAAAGGRR
ncbi:DUF4129 domain-containing protein [Kitasatospora sp. NPDC056327]|uniref:DUF4129 domain-containing protein n=1 Tax=Kitasatospora sp. NPDC056327 TaxID=3345785 RepID=UPI0035E2E81A